MSIYTRTGDLGSTGLATGQKVLKSSPVIEFIGLVDEMNSVIGICVSSLEAEPEVDFTEEIEVLESIQMDLFVVGAVAAGAKMRFDALAEAANIEKTIDDYEKILPKLTNFILPGGAASAAHLHNARTVVRRIERHAVALKSQSLMSFVPYLNRLSDLLFVVARFVNQKLNVRETIWKS